MSPDPFSAFRAILSSMWWLSQYKDVISRRYCSEIKMLKLLKAYAQFPDCIVFRKGDYRYQNTCILLLKVWSFSLKGFLGVRVNIIVPNNMPWFYRMYISWEIDFILVWVNYCIINSVMNNYLCNMKCYRNMCSCLGRLMDV